MKKTLVLTAAMLFLCLGFLFGLAGLFLASEITIYIYVNPPIVWRFTDTFYFPPVVWMAICWGMMVLLMAWAVRIEYHEKSS